jgi:hypothetical protein
MISTVRCHATRSGRASDGSEQLAARERPTIHQPYRQAADMGGFCVIGTPREIADVMQAGVVRKQRLQRLQYDADASPRRLRRLRRYGHTRLQ